jgi:uncharacterized protein GlcG (DUF336 family)
MNITQSNAFLMMSIAVSSVFATPNLFADAVSGDESIPDHALVTQKLKEIVAEDNAGFGLHMWATIVNRDGIAKVVAMSGDNRGDQWPGSRVISAQKANTANAFSLPGLALSTANLFTAVQPGNSLFGLQFSNPVDTANAYAGPSEVYGTANDPLVGMKPGGVNVFGGGLGLYNSDGKLVGAIGVSGDSSCTDHVTAWKLRHALELDYIPGGVHPTRGDDNIVFDQTSGWAHPVCDDNVAAITDALPAPRTANVEMLSRARVTPEGLFQFILSGTPNQSFSVEKSEDLKTWNPLRDIRTDEFGNATIEDPADSANQSYRTIKN